MDQPLLVFIILGLAAAFLPLQFGYEITLFNREEGRRRAAEFAGGIILFRVLLIFVLGLLFTGVSVALARAIRRTFVFGHDLLGEARHWAASGEHILVDVLLIAGGVLLLKQAVQQFRRSKSPDDEAEEIEKAERRGRSLVLLGFAWVAISANQWIFTVVGVNQILALSPGTGPRLGLAALFLALTSLMILLPFAGYLVAPQKVEPLLETLNGWINRSLGLVFVILLLAGGIYLIWIGGLGVYRWLGPFS